MKRAAAAPRALSQIELGQILRIKKSSRPMTGALKNNVVGAGAAPVIFGGGGPPRLFFLGFKPEKRLVASGCCLNVVGRAAATGRDMGSLGI